MTQHLTAIHSPIPIAFVLAVTLTTLLNFVTNVSKLDAIAATIIIILSHLSAYFAPAPFSQIVISTPFIPFPSRKLFCSNKT
jgi:hypothetical protein